MSEKNALDNPFFCLLFFACIPTASIYVYNNSGRNLTVGLESIDGTFSFYQEQEIHPNSDIKALLEQGTPFVLRLTDIDKRVYQYRFVAKPDANKLHTSMSLQIQQDMQIILSQ